jgi:hypothetical protein
MPISEAQLGLIIATFIIIVFAAMLRRMGALSTAGTVSAIILSIVIASFLFVTQFVMQ